MNIYFLINNFTIHFKRINNSFGFGFTHYLLT